MLEQKILDEMQVYIQSHLNPIMTTDICESLNFDYNILEDIHNSELEDFIITKRKPTLQQVLFNFIDKKASSDSDIYKKAGIDRKLFSKIRSNPNYRPGKYTIIALALALELNKKDTDKLLSSAGYSLSDSDTSDLIIQFCLEKKIYDIDYVNQALEYFSMKPLSGVR